MKLDYNGMFSSMFDSFGVPYKNKWIVPMTKEDQARATAQTQAAVIQGKAGIEKLKGEVKKDVDNNQAENRMLIQTGKHVLDTHGSNLDTANQMLLQKQEQQTPEAEGLQRASKGAFAKLDQSAFE